MSYIKKYTCVCQRNMDDYGDVIASIINIGGVYDVDINIMTGQYEVTSNGGVLLTMQREEFIGYFTLRSLMRDRKISEIFS